MARCFCLALAIVGVAMTGAGLWLHMQAAPSQLNDANDWDETNGLSAGRQLSKAGLGLAIVGIPGLVVVELARTAAGEPRGRRTPPGGPQHE